MVNSKKEISNNTNKNHPCWVLFPLRGLDITDEQHDLFQPAFGDFTVVSKNHIRQIIKLLNLSKDPVHGEQNEHDTIYMVENATFREDFHSFIAVRRRGNFSIKNPMPKWVKDAKARSYQIAALFTLVLLAESASGETCGLVEQLHKQTQSTIMFDIDNGEFMFQSGGRYHLRIQPLHEAIILSLNELKQTLYKAQYQHLTNALLPQRSLLPKSLSRAITQAAVRLSDAIHSVTPSSQLLGAVTAMEILLASQSEKYESLTNRLSALLGNESLIQHDVETVLQSRHLYVHQGQEIEEIEISLKAVGLALSSLLHYAKIAPLFSGKDELVNYLDFIHSGDNLSAHWDEVQQRTFHDLQEHERKTVELPFLESLSKVILM